MSERVNIIIEKNENGYSAYSPDLQDARTQGLSFMEAITNLQSAIEQYLATSSVTESQQQHKPIWEVADEILMNIPDEVLNELPHDGAQQHDHYIYGTPKKEV
ncbi:MAG: type II toxin-antitoxin system HicB family antitoxin [Stigonema ocellatum SAG 48.90 = DSM 106950]|nr:type II toxin-antitoxin system HicB family antitoxin [Stigonema ocellatum SAG 48.90 = DSM 106950]